MIFQGSAKTVELIYTKRKAYSLRFLVFPGIYVLIASLLHGIVFIAGFRQKKLIERAKEISELRFLAMKNQLEPHFLFNSLNSIGHLLITEERMKAYEYLENLSSLLRNAVSSAEEISVSLEEELGFTIKYLELEKLRFEKKFTYNIQMDENVPMDFPVPKMIVQLHAENAIKHALMPLKEDGLLNIVIYIEKKFVVIEIIDNGPGIESGETSRNSTGKGLIISRKMVDLFSDITGREVYLKLSNRDQSKGEQGTRVTIKISRDHK